MADNRFNTCLHFDLDNPTHLRALNIIRNYSKSEYHSYSNFIAFAVIAFYEKQNTEERNEVLINEIRKVVREEISKFSFSGLQKNDDRLKNEKASSDENAESIKVTTPKILENEEKDKQQIMDSFDSSFLKSFGTKISFDTT